MTVDEINLKLQEASDAEREDRLNAEYEEFLEWLYYCWECDQWDREMEFYNDY